MKPCTRCGRPAPSLMTEQEARARFIILPSHWRCECGSLQKFKRRPEESR